MKLELEHEFKYIPERIEYIALQSLIIARNKLINDLLEQIPESERGFREALSMRTKAFEEDKTIWAESCEKVKKELADKKAMEQASKIRG